MKTASAALQNFLATTQSFAGIADCYLFTLSDGLSFGWTNYDIPLTVNGGTYGPGPGIKRNRITQTPGLEVSALEIDLIAGPTHQIPKISGVGSSPVLVELAADRFAGAEVVVRRVYMPTPGDTSLGSVIQFAGSVADVQAKRTSAHITVKSKTEKLDHVIPRHLIQSGCAHTLFDEGCTLSEAAARVSGTVTGGDRFTVNTDLAPPGGTASAPASSPSLTQSGANADANQAPQIVYVVITYTTGNGESIASSEAFLALTKNSLLRVASPPGITGALGWNVYVGTATGDEQKQNQAPIPIGTSYAETHDGFTQGTPPPTISTAGFYALGVITFTSGANKNLKRSILGNSGGTLSLKTGLPQASAVGDTFYATPGCDKKKETCQFKFSNLIHIMAAPFVPTPESSI